MRCVAHSIAVAAHELAIADPAAQQTVAPGVEAADATVG
jgi:hypothetical protein